jgi:hypothetical protein
MVPGCESAISGRTIASPMQKIISITQGAEPRMITPSATWWLPVLARVAVGDGAAAGRFFARERRVDTGRAEARHGS